MLTVEIPGRGTLTLRHLACDFNGTLACDGVLLDEVPERLALVEQLLAVHILTAGTHGGLEEAQAQLAQAFRVARTATEPIWQPISTGADKADYVQRLGAHEVVALGNGANDAPMLEIAALGIAVLGPEGLARTAAEAADVLCPSPLAALDLLLHPKRLVATLRL